MGLYLLNGLRASLFHKCYHLTVQLIFINSQLLNYLSSSLFNGFGPHIDLLFELPMTQNKFILSSQCLFLHYLARFQYGVSFGNALMRTFYGNLVGTKFEPRFLYLFIDSLLVCLEVGDFNKSIFFFRLNSS